MFPSLRDVKAGGQLSARDLNAVYELVEQLSRLIAAPPLELTWDTNGPRLRLLKKPAIWARITGRQARGDADVTVPGLNYYSGVELDDKDGEEGTEDRDTGLHFYLDGVSLREIAGNNEVPENAIVRAYPSDNGPYYTFLFEPNLTDDYSGYSGGDALNNFPDGTGACPVGTAVSDLVQCDPDNPGSLKPVCLVVRDPRTGRLLPVLGLDADGNVIGE